MNEKNSRTGKRNRKRSERSSNIRYQLKASYERNKRIYTILDISANSTLDDLCHMILDAFDFTYEHLYLFNFGGRGYGEGEDIYAYMPEPGENGTNIRLGRLNLVLKQKFYFLYDFGDDWGFDIQVQKIYETNEHVINGIVSVKGELEQYPEWDEEDEEEDWLGLQELFDGEIDEETLKALDDLGLGDLDEEELENLIGEIVREKMGIFPANASVFRVDSTLTVREVLDSLDEDDVRMYAAAFLDEKDRSDYLIKKDIDWVRDQYAGGLLQNREHMLLFQRSITAEIFKFMMTAKADPENGVLDWEVLWKNIPMDDEMYAQEVALSFMQLYTMGVCMPEMNDKSEIQSFLIPQEMRDAYESWLNQPGVGKKQKFYEKMQEVANILMIRYGVIEMEKMHTICQEILHKKMKKEDFEFLISSRLAYFGRYEIHVLEDKGVSYVSAFNMDDTEAVLRKRQDYPDLTYRPFSMEQCDNYVKNGPFWDVEEYGELVEAIWKSVQDIQTLSIIIRKVTDMGILGADAEDVIKSVRLELNSVGKRMTRKLQGLIRNVVKNMPLAARYGYTAAEQNF